MRGLKVLQLPVPIGVALLALRQIQILYSE